MKMTEFEKMNDKQRAGIVAGVIAGDVACCLTAANHLMAQPTDEDAPIYHPLTALCDIGRQFRVPLCLNSLLCATLTTAYERAPNYKPYSSAASTQKSHKQTMAYASLPSLA
jgi:hypothetical protein